jgi:hypothetical protein
VKISAILYRNASGNASIEKKETGSDRPADGKEIFAERAAVLV